MSKERRLNKKLWARKRKGRVSESEYARRAEQARMEAELQKEYEERTGTE